MDSNVPENSLIRFDEVYHETEPIAVIKLQPHELSHKNKELKFDRGYDDIDYLQYARLEIMPGCTIALVSHQNTPIPGTDIYVAPTQVDRVLVLIKAVSTLHLFVQDLLWIHPNLERQFQKRWQYRQMRRSRLQKSLENNLIMRISPRQHKNIQVVRGISIDIQHKKRYPH
jgi:hypothetical protein